MRNHLNENKLKSGVRGNTRYINIVKMKGPNKLFQPQIKLYATKKRLKLRVVCTLLFT